MQTVLLIGKCYSFVVYVVNDDYKNVNALHELPKKKKIKVLKKNCGFWLYVKLNKREATFNKKK